MYPLYLIKKLPRFKIAELSFQMHIYSGFHKPCHEKLHAKQTVNTLGEGEEQKGNAR